MTPEFFTQFIFAYDFDLKNDLSLCRKRLLIYRLQFTRKTMGLHSAFVPDVAADLPYFCF